MCPWGYSPVELGRRRQCAVRIRLIDKHETGPVKRGPVDSDSTGLTAVTSTTVGLWEVYTETLCRDYGLKHKWKTFYILDASELRISGLPVPITRAQLAAKPAAVTRREGTVWRKIVTSGVCQTFDNAASYRSL